MEIHPVIEALRRVLPPVFRWAGGVARQLRGFNVALAGKTSGSASTDALTLADLTVQELVVSALRDGDPILRQCRLEAEEQTGDLGRFASFGPLTLALDPIDGTRAYRDKYNDGYAIALTLRDVETVHYSLVYLPEIGREGTWVEVADGRIALGEDDCSRPADAVLAELPSIDPATRPDSKKIYLIGFQEADAERALAVMRSGLEGYTADDMPGSIFNLFATGEFGGSLIHTPNVYDFPVTLHMARVLGGDALRVDTGRPADFHDLWLDDRADMLRMPGIIACSHSRRTLEVLCRLARDWNPVRYATG
ncbi:MAG: inositol monophosphatase [Planctomycetes bacterium]|nr:inositol monophosphatase [Planctomycetota bacterium]